jgi:hypothetical protein
MSVCRLRNWEIVQHYKDRNPPGIKLHFELLSSEDWVVLADASRVLAVACMLIASRNSGLIRADAKGKQYLQRVAYLNSLPDFNPLIECGFLEPASTMLADASALQASARPETETETEEEKKDNPPSPSEKDPLPGVKKKPAVKTATRIPEDFKLTPDRFELAQLEGVENPGRTFDAFVDYWRAAAGANARKHDWDATWRNWCRRDVDFAKQKQGTGNGRKSFEQIQADLARKAQAAARRSAGDGAGRVVGDDAGIRPALGHGNG